MADSKPKRPAVDWDAIEPEWLAGVKSKAQLSKEYKVSRAAMDKHFAAKGVERDATAAIKARADSLVTHDAVTPKVTGETKVTERAVVEANAEMLANVIRGHRKDLGRLRGVVSVLLDKVENILLESDLFKQVGEICASPDENGVDKVNELYQKVIGLPVQTETTKKLAETMKVLIELERKVFKIDEPEENATKSVTVILSRQDVGL